MIYTWGIMHNNIFPLGIFFFFQTLFVCTKSLQIFYISLGEYALTIQHNRINCCYIPACMIP